MGFTSVSSAFFLRMVSGVLDRGLVAAESVTQEPRHAADRRDADAGHIVDLSIGEILLKEAGDLPAIGERLELGWRAQVFEKITTFGQVLQADDGPEQGVLVAFALARCVLSIGFHGLGGCCANVIARYYISTDEASTFCPSYIYMAAGYSRKK